MTDVYNGDDYDVEDSYLDIGALNPAGDELR